MTLSQAEELAFLIAHKPYSDSRDPIRELAKIVEFLLEKLRDAC